MNRKVLGSNPGRSKRTISSPYHVDQLRNPPSLQLYVNQSFFSGSKMARRKSLSGAIAPLNLSASMAHTGTLLLLYLLTMYLSRKVIFFLVLYEALYTLLVSHMHTPGTIYLIFTDPIKPTSRRVPFTNIII